MSKVVTIHDGTNEYTHRADQLQIINDRNPRKQGKRDSQTVRPVADNRPQSAVRNNPPGRKDRSESK